MLQPSALDRIYIQSQIDTITLFFDTTMIFCWKATKYILESINFVFYLSTNINMGYPLLNVQIPILHNLLPCWKWHESTGSSIKLYYPLTKHVSGYFGRFGSTWVIGTSLMWVNLIDHWLVKFQFTIIIKP